MPVTRTRTPRPPTFLAFVRKLGVELTPAQSVLARIAFDRVEPSDLEDDEQELARQLFGPVETIPSSARAVLVAVCGARSGKSFVLGALYSLWRAVTADLTTLAKGERAVALVVCPDLRLSRIVVRYVQGHAPSVATVIASSADSLTLRRPDDAVIVVEALPATRGGSAVRGRSLVSAVLDECAFFRDESAAINDLEIFSAIAPRVLPGGLVVLSSTPWIEAGLLHSEFSRNYGEPQSALACHAPTTLMRPDPQTAAMVEREQERDDSNARREFGAEFISGGSGLFLGSDLLGLALARDLSPAYVMTLPGNTRIGGDIGLVTDASAFVAVRRLDDGVLVIVDLLEIRPSKGAPLALSQVVKRGCEFAAKHGQQSIVVDHHELVAAREHLPAGFTLRPCRGGADAREDRFLRTREAFKNEHVRIPGAFNRLVNQLGLIVAKPRTGGGTAIILPRRAGTHLDAAAAFVLAAGELVDRMRDPPPRFGQPTGMRSQIQQQEVGYDFVAQHGEDGARAVRRRGQSMRSTMSRGRF